MNETDHATELLLLSRDGAPRAADELYQLAYTRLRSIASAQLRREREGHTLSTTDLVHEAYLKLFNQTRCDWQSRAHFLAIAATAMRRILVDHARRRSRRKHGGHWRQEPLTTGIAGGAPQTDAWILALHDALERLAQSHPEKARLVEMRYFAGLTEEESASALGLSRRTAARQWAYARAWLHRELTSRDEPTPPAGVPSRHVGS